MKMFLVNLFLIALFSFFMEKVESCICLRESPEAKIYRADNAVIIRVRGSEPNFYTGGVTYYVDVVDVLKESWNNRLDTRSKILTSYSDLMCGASYFKPNEYYIVELTESRGQPLIHACKIILDGNKVSKNRWSSFITEQSRNSNMPWNWNNNFSNNYYNYNWINGQENGQWVTDNKVSGVPMQEVQYIGYPSMRKHLKKSHGHHTGSNIYWLY